MESTRSSKVSDKEVVYKILKPETRNNIEKSAAAARQQAAIDLQRHLVQSINNSDCRGDVVFICKDGERVDALKMFCVGRSDMLTAMFMSGMSESNSSTVTLPEIHSSTLLSILEYLYTGDISTRRPKDWKMKLEVLAAARFFMLPLCVDIVEGLLLEHVNDAEKDLRQAAKLLSLAVEYKASDLELVEGLTHLFSRTWMHRNYGSQLSEEALDFLLKHTKSTGKKNRRTSLYEFYRFGGILMMWALCHSGLVPSNDAKSLFDQIIPDAKEKLYRLQHTETGEVGVEWLPGYEVDSAKNEIFDLLQANLVCREAAVRLLAHIDWEQIPPQLFTRIVEPLKLVSDHQLMNLFRCYYINTPSNVHLSWIHGSQLVQSRRGFCIQGRSGCGVGCGGSAVCELQSNPDEKLAIWTITIEEFHCTYLHLGFVFRLDEATIRSWNFETPFLAAMDSSQQKTSGRILLFYPNSRDISFNAVNGHGQTYAQPKQSLTVEFRCDRDARQCSIKVGSLDLGPVFKDLPCQHFYPYLSMDSHPYLFMGSLATMTIAVQSGFDIVHECSDI